MTSKVLELDDVIQPDQLAIQITEKWLEWDMLRQPKKQDWEEIRRYVYATDTSHTSNSQLPWKNKTTVPKLCQIRDNLYANYVATLFPQRKWLTWEANNKDANSVRTTLGEDLKFSAVGFMTISKGLMRLAPGPI